MLELFVVFAGTAIFWNHQSTRWPFGQRLHGLFVQQVTGDWAAQSETAEICELPVATSLIE